MNTSYLKLLTHLNEADAVYRLIDHPAEGRTDLASELRGHTLEKAAKCMVVEVHGKDGSKRHVLAVVPGDRRVDFRKIRKLFGGKDAYLAGPDVAEGLTGCKVGCIVPFSFHDELHPVIDPALLEHDEVFFNAARLDRSVGVAAHGFRTAAKAVFETISREPAALAA